MRTCIILILVAGLAIAGCATKTGTGAAVGTGVGAAVGAGAGAGNWRQYGGHPSGSRHRGNSRRLNRCGDRTLYGQTGAIHAPGHRKF